MTYLTESARRWRGAVSKSKMSATEKEDDPVDEGEPSVPKKSRGFGYSLSAKLWVLSNYEYCDTGDRFVPKSEIMAHFENEKESIKRDGKPVNLSDCSLGRIINDVWKGKVASARKKHKDGTREVILKNLHRKVPRPSQSEQHAHMNLIHVPGWEFRINSELSFSLIRVENWLLDNQRVVTEIRADPGSDEESCNLSLNSHGCRVDPGELGLQFGHISALNEKVQVIADFMSTCHLCQGFEVCETMSRDFLPNRVALFSLAAKPDEQESRGFSKKCQIISPRGSACHDCSRLKVLEARKRQRSEARSGDINSYTNERYLTEEQILAKLEMMRRAQKSAKGREQKLKRIIEQNNINVDDC